MRTQTVMEFANIIVDDHNDFSKFSKEEAINSFTNKVVGQSILDKQVEELIVFVITETGSRQSTGRKSIATETNNQFVVTDKPQKQATSEKSESLVILNDEIKKEPSKIIQQISSQVSLMMPQSQEEGTWIFLNMCVLSLCLNQKILRKLSQMNIG